MQTKMEHAYTVRVAITRLSWRLSVGPKRPTRCTCSSLNSYQALVQLLLLDTPEDPDGTWRNSEAPPGAS